MNVGGYYLKKDKREKRETGWYRGKTSICSWNATMEEEVQALLGLKPSGSQELYISCCICIQWLQQLLYPYSSISKEIRVHEVLPILAKKKAS